VEQRASRASEQIATFIGIEMDDKYFEIAKKGIEDEQVGHQPTLLDQAA
jgi:hypothetical protein